MAHQITQKNSRYDDAYRFFLVGGHGEGRKRWKPPFTQL